MLHEDELTCFKDKVWDYYRENKRAFPWRDDVSEYGVFISEVMLQQTQAPRVVEKFNSFMRVFPDFDSLAHASRADVLREWKGLGYNRRALLLRDAAQIIVSRHGGKLPRTIPELDDLPGIGYATACSISAFAFNEPVVFIETNIRTVFLHAFFAERARVPDNELLPLIAATVPPTNAREWYSALMDYGTMLKKTQGNANTRSVHYTKQSTFKGSARELRGKILSVLLESHSFTARELAARIGTDGRMPTILTQMEKEGFIIRTGDSYMLNGI